MQLDVFRRDTTFAVDWALRCGGFFSLLARIMRERFPPTLVWFLFICCCFFVCFVCVCVFLFCLFVCFSSGDQLAHTTFQSLGQSTVAQ